MARPKSKRSIKTMFQSKLVTFAVMTFALLSSQIGVVQLGFTTVVSAATSTCTATDKTKCVTCPNNTLANTYSDCPITCVQNSQVVDCAKAQDPAQTSGNCANLNQCDLIQQYIQPAVDFLAALVGIAVTIAIVYGGIEYASSGGDSQKVSIAKNRIRNAIIALVTFFFLFALLNFLIPGGIL